MKIRLADGTERTLTRFIRDEWVSTTAETDAAAASFARLLDYMDEKGILEDEAVFKIVSGKARPVGATVIERQPRPPNFP